MLSVILAIMNKHRAVFASSIYNNFLYKRLNYIVKKKCHYGLETNDLFHAAKHTRMPRPCLLSVCWCSGPQTPGAASGLGTVFTPFPLSKTRGNAHVVQWIFPLCFPS